MMPRCGWCFQSLWIAKGSGFAGAFLVVLMDIGGFSSLDSLCLFFL